MKISASVYSDKNRSLEETIKDLVEHQVELLHVDCNDDLSVFEDIKLIRQWCALPIDLHVITEDPSKYYDLLRENPVEYITFQYEDLKTPLNIPSDISGKKGLAVITPTPVSVFEEYFNYDFILIMATIPGQSGGKFDAVNFSKIRQFRNQFPGKSIHVDGGVNGEVSFILRNMGVSSSVSGSYLFNAPSIGHALMNLTNRNIESEFQIKDFMIPIAECPKVEFSSITLSSVLNSIEKGNMGFCLVVDKDNQFKGLISNADVRRGMLKNLNDLNKIIAEDLINSSPTVVQEDETVFSMLKMIKKCSFPIMYLPVVEKGGKSTGIVNFTNLIKAEL
jgi:pentose-5-phosphate-3-epimerase/predicted transcriptional regulator